MYKGLDRFSTLNRLERQIDVGKGKRVFEVQPQAGVQLAGLNKTDDPIVGTDEVAELANIFRAANAEVTLHWETAGHTLSQGDVLMAFDWMRKFFDIPRSSARK